ncbi:MAG: hypothetical protein AAGD32_06225 [Planctomycetota bacterium]
MANVTLVMDSDEQRLWNSLQRVIGQQEKMEGSARSVGRAYRQLEREGRRVFEATRTPAEKYSAELVRLQTLLRRGVIDQQTFNRAVGQADEELKAAGAATKNAFGSGALSDLKAYAAGMLGVGAAIGAVTAAVREQRRAREEAGQRVMDSEGRRNRRRQVAANQEEYEALGFAEDRLRTNFGFTEQEASDVVYTAKSSGDRYMQTLDFFATTRRLGINPNTAIGADQKISSNFQDVGSPEAVMNKLLAAAGPSPVPVDEIASAAANAAPAFSAIGATDEELLALGGVYAEIFKNADAGFERANSLAAQVYQKMERGQIRLQGEDANLKGFDLLDALPRLAEEGKLLNAGGKAVGVTQFLEDRNAVFGFEKFREKRDFIRQRVSEVEQAGLDAGTSDSLLRVKLGFRDTRSEVAEQARISKQKMDVDREEKYGNDELIIQTASEEFLKAIDDEAQASAVPLLGSAKYATYKTLNESNRYLYSNTRNLKSAFDDQILPLLADNDPSTNPRFSRSTQRAIAERLGGERLRKFNRFDVLRQHQDRTAFARDVLFPEEDNDPNTSSVLLKSSDGRRQARNQAEMIGGDFPERLENAIQNLDRAAAAMSAAADQHKQAASEQAGAAKQQQDRRQPTPPASP